MQQNLYNLIQQEKMTNKQKGTRNEQMIGNAQAMTWSAIISYGKDGPLQSE
jgi:hypothetical protein